MRQDCRDTAWPHHRKTVKSMKRIGIISDTHAYWDDKYLH